MLGGDREKLGGNIMTLNAVPPRVPYPILFDPTLLEEVDHDEKY